MNLIRGTLEIDADTDTRLREMATERRQDVAAVLAEAVAVLDSVVDLAGRRSPRTAAATTNSNGPGSRLPLMMSRRGSQVRVPRTNCLVRDRARSDEPASRHIPSTPLRTASPYAALT